MEYLDLFLALFLLLAEDEHHVHCVSVGSEVTLALREVFFSDGVYEPIEQDSGKYFASDGE